jgi:hypothetical protein
MMAASTHKDNQCCFGEHQLDHCSKQQRWRPTRLRREKGRQELNDTHADMQFEMR